MVPGKAYDGDHAQYKFQANECNGYACQNDLKA